MSLKDAPKLEKERCPDVSVVILNWNTCKLLEKCLHSLELPQPDLKYEVVVVDNASEDNSREMVKRLFPRVRLLANKRNVGFGEGNNVAIPHTTGRYVLFLNSDTEVMEGALAAMVRFADAQPDIGILGPKLLNGDGSLQYSCRRYPNLGTGFFRNTPLGRLFPHNRFTTDYLYQDWDHNTPRDVDWVSGAALMIRRTLLDQIGGFDTTFFMYCEDVDLCWRANHADLTPLPPSLPARSSLGKGVSEALPVVSSLPSPSPSREGKERIAAPSPYEGEGRGGVTPPEGKASPRRNAHARVTPFPSEERASREGGRGVRSTWRVTYFPDAVIYHLIGKSTDIVPTRMTYEFHRSQYIFYKKHYAASTPFVLRPLIPVGIGLRAVGQMARYRVNYWRRRLRGPQPPKTQQGGKS